MCSDGLAELPAALETLREGVESLRRCTDLDLPAAALTELVGATVEVRNQLERQLAGVQDPGDQLVSPTLGRALLVALRRGPRTPCSATLSGVPASASRWASRSQLPRPWWA
jgi:hypothetical protein